MQLFSCGRWELFSLTLKWSPHIPLASGRGVSSERGRGEGILYPHNDVVCIPPEGVSSGFCLT